MVRVHGIGRHDVTYGRQAETLHAVPECGTDPRLLVRSAQTEEENSHGPDDGGDDGRGQAIFRFSAT